MSKAEPGAGDVPIVLDGKEHLMQPTYERCLAISKLGGGMGPLNVIQRCRGLDFDTLVEVISIGTGYTSHDQKKQIAKALYAAGTMSVVGDCIEFITIVNNGGRRPDDEVEGEGDREDPLAESASAPSSSTSDLAPAA